MKFTPEWKTVVKRSWSFWGNAALVVASAIAGGFASDGTFYWLMAFANGAVMALRLLHQKGLGDE